MNFDLANCEARAREAVSAFWRNREAAQKKQIESGNQDIGSRSAVTAGKNMDGFLDIIIETLDMANGSTPYNICKQQHVLTLPGFYRPTKIWDMLVMHHEKLVAAFELKSQVGPSFGNNFNNRSEEVIGTAHDFWTAYNKDAFGNSSPKPFLGLMMLLEDCDESNTSVNQKEPHFPVDTAFKDTSYAQRYDLLCLRLMQERLYSSATLFVSPSEAKTNGEYWHMSQLTSLESFVAKFLEHLATFVRSK